MAIGRSAFPLVQGFGRRQHGRTVTELGPRANGSPTSTVTTWATSLPGTHTLATGGSRSHQAAASGRPNAGQPDTEHTHRHDGGRAPATTSGSCDLHSLARGEQASGRKPIGTAE